MALVLPSVALRGMPHFMSLGNSEHDKLCLHDSHFCICISYCTWLKQFLGALRTPLAYECFSRLQSGNVYLLLVLLRFFPAFLSGASHLLLLCGLFCLCTHGNLVSQTTSGALPLVMYQLIQPHPNHLCHQHCCPGCCTFSMSHTSIGLPWEHLSGLHEGAQG